ncbi:hypothetical protein pipiens_015221 [Culex pipiens pipiens]|uniref:Uncharacterized protein n=1 Tax=Culex pipiens pipiens TaxID=38569 RepID=A0ABD1CRE6_CULPP
MVLVDCEEEPVGDFQLVKMREFHGNKVPRAEYEPHEPVAAAALECGWIVRGRCPYLCHVQPSIEELIMPKMLCLIGTKLPRLRQLETSLAEVETILTPSFLATMPHLRKLSLTASLNNQLINFTPYKCTNLNELYMNCLQPVENSLQAFLSGSKKLQKLELFHCALDSWSNVLTMLADLPSLRHLKLGYLRLPDIVTPAPPNLRTNLQHLELFGRSSMTSAMIVQLCTLSPQLKVLHLCKPPSVDDSTLQTLWRLLPLLTRLVHCKKPSGCCRLFKLC